MKKMKLVAEVLIGLCMLSLNNIGKSEKTEYEMSTLSAVLGSTQSSSGAADHQGMMTTIKYKNSVVPRIATERQETPKTSSKKGIRKAKSGRERGQDGKKRNGGIGTTREQGHDKGRNEKEKLKARLKRTYLYAVVVSCVSCLLIGAGITLFCVYCMKQRERNKREARAAVEMVTKRFEAEKQSNNYISVASNASGGSLTFEGTRWPGSIPNLSHQSAPTRLEQHHSDYKLATNPNLHCRSREQGGTPFSGDNLRQDYFVLEVNAPEENHGNGNMSQERPLPSIPHDPGAVLPGLVGFERKDATSTVPLDLASSYPPVEEDMSRRDAHIKTYQPLVSEASLSRETTYEELE